MCNARRAHACATLVHHTSVLLVHRQGLHEDAQCGNGEGIWGERGGEAKCAMDCVHTHVQTLVHHTGVLLVHREACTRMHSVETENELGGEGRRSKACNGLCAHARASPHASHE